MDMYKGIIQHETYLTEYLRKQIESRGLEQPLGMGRIYRVVYEGNWLNRLGHKFKYSEQPKLNQATDKELIKLLSHPNGWWRDNAQRLLVERNNKSIVPEIVDILKASKNNSLGKLHALWTLEGMDIYSTEIIQHGIEVEDIKVVAAALSIGERNKNTPAADTVLAIYEQVLENKAAPLRLQLALSLGEFMESDSMKVMDMLVTIVDENGENPLIQEAIVSSLAGREQIFLKLLKEKSPDNHAMIAFLMEVINSTTLKYQLKDKSFTKREKEQYVLGKSLYEKTCASCHHENGEGLVPIAPPLVKSEWVEGPEERLVLVVLHGLEGPVTVRNKVYQVPEVQPIMPGLNDNPEFTDEKLAALLTYIRNAWTNEAAPISATTVNEIRKHSMDRKTPFTEKEF